MRKLVVLLILGLAIAAYFYFDGQQYLSVGIFQGALSTTALANGADLFCCVSFGCQGLSLPGAAVLTIIGGMIFGLWTGLCIGVFCQSALAQHWLFLSRALFCATGYRANLPSILGSINQGVMESRVLSICLVCA